MRVSMESLIAALSLEKKVDEYLLLVLDNADQSIQNHALMLLLFLELGEQDNSPDRCIALLSCASPKIRLVAAEALQNFLPLKNFRQFVIDFVNKDLEHKKHIPSEFIDAFAKIVAYGSPKLRTKAILKFLSKIATGSDEKFLQSWDIFSKRFVKEINSIKIKPKEKLIYSLEQLQQIALGTYIGLARQISTDVKIRQQALKQILQVGLSQTSSKTTITPVLLQALRDPATPMRAQAFEALLKLKVDVYSIVQETLACGHTNTGIMGLKLAAEQKDGAKELQKVLLNFENDLAWEASKILAQKQKKLSTLQLGIAAKSKNVRAKSVEELARLYEKEPGARKILYEALESKHFHVYYQAAIKLAHKKDKRAFATLIKSLEKAHIEFEYESLNPLFNALAALEHKNTTKELLKVLEKEISSKYNDNIFHTIGELRNPESVPGLLKYLDDSTDHDAVYSAILTISGYDQDYTEDKQERKKQHPRHPNVLLQLLHEEYRLGHGEELEELLDSARIAPQKVTDEIINFLITHPKDSIQHAAIEAVGWRVKNRKASIEPLRKALESSSPQTRFLAAEALAQAGHSDGVNVLLSCIDVEVLDHYDEVRAIKALGQLADLRALEVLLRLANDRDHEMHFEAIEAIGHMSASPRHKDIFKILAKKIRSGGYYYHVVSVMNGLRWFNTPESWTLLYECATSTDAGVRQHLTTLLEFHDTSTSREVLIKMIKEDESSYVALEAAKTLRKFHGKDSLEPDYVFIQSRHINLEPDTSIRLGKEGEVATLLKLIPKIRLPQYREQLVNALVIRTPSPTKEALANLDSPQWETVEIALRILGNAKALSSKEQQTLLKITKKAWETWQQTRQEIEEDNKKPEELDIVTRCLCLLIWNLKRWKLSFDSISILKNKDQESIAVRKTALQFLQTEKTNKEIISILQETTNTGNPQLRRIAAAILGKNPLTASAPVWERLVEDYLPTWFKECKEQKKALEQMAPFVAKPHTQGLLLPYFIAQKRTKDIKKVALDRSLPESMRLGAIEGLAHITNKESFDVLRSIGLEEKEEANIGQAAWKALRRGKRLQAKAS